MGCNVIALSSFFSYIYEWISINTFYILSLIFVFCTPAFVLRDIIWKRNWPHILIYCLVFGILGSYYCYFNAPDYVSTTYRVIKGYVFLTEIQKIILPTISWMGWGLLIYYIEKIVINVFQVDEKTRPLGEYLFYFFLYALYLDAVISILNPLFYR